MLIHLISQFGKCETIQLVSFTYILPLSPSSPSSASSSWALMLIFINTYITGYLFIALNCPGSKKGIKEGLREYHYIISDLSRKYKI